MPGQHAPDHPQRIGGHLAGLAQGRRDGGEGAELLEGVVLGRWHRLGGLQAKRPGRLAGFRIPDLPGLQFEGMPRTLAVDLDHGRAAALAQLVDQRIKVAKLVHGLTIHRGDGVARLEHAVRGAAGLDRGDGRRQQQVAPGESGGASHVFLIEADRQSGQGQGPVLLVAIGVDDPQPRIAAVHRRHGQGLQRFHPRVDGPVVDRLDTVAAVQAGFGGNTGGRSQGGGIVRTADDEHRPEQGHAQHQVGDRTGRDDGDPLQDRLAVEGLGLFGDGDVAFSLVQHLHVTAQRDGGDRELGAVAVPARP